MWIDQLRRLLPRDFAIRGTPESALRRLEEKLGRPLPRTYRQFALWAGDTPPPALELEGYDLSVPAVLAYYEPIQFRRKPASMRIGASDSPDRFDMFIGLDGDDPPVFMSETHALFEDEGYLLSRRFSELIAFALFDREVLARCAYHVRVQKDVGVDLGDDGEEVDAFVRDRLHALGCVDLPPNEMLLLMQRDHLRLAYHRLPDSLSFTLFVGAPTLAPIEALCAEFPADLVVSPVPVRRR